MSALTLRAAGAGVGFSVLSGTVNLPRVGAWSADLTVANPAAMSGKVDLELSPTLTLRGTVARAGVLEQVLHARVVGGGNGLRSKVRPKHYTAPTARVVLSDLLADVGESLSTTADRDVLNTQFEHWTTDRDAGGQGRPLPARARGRRDRVAHPARRDALGGTGDLARIDGERLLRDRRRLARDRRASAQHGGTRPAAGDGDQRAEHRSRRVPGLGGTVRALVTLSNGDADVLDRPKGSLAALSGVCPTIDYQRLFRGKVLKQHPNLRRVDVQPDDPRLPPMSNIPLRVGVPGLDVTLTPGHRLAIGWEDGQPDRPMTALWEPGTQGTTPVKETFHADVIELGGPVTPIKDGVVTGQGKDPYTGLPYWMLGNSSTTIGAKT
jgi:hypothetical protein